MNHADFTKHVHKPFSFAECYATVKRHYDDNNFNWPMIIYITLAHIGGIVGLFYIPYCHTYTLLWALFLYPITVNSITSGAHRLWSHRSYKASFSVRLFLMLSNSIANQGSLWHWARDHRVHHKCTDTFADPHSAGRGFFFSHIGWLLVKKHPSVIAAGKTLNFDDLAADSVVVFQKKYDPWFTLFMCYVFPGLVCMLWGDNFWNGYWVAGALRYIIVLHITWLVNSAAHFYGDRPYNPTAYASENAYVSYLGGGEGWHNWHHKFPYDYAASEFGIDKQWNPSKLFIDVCAFFGGVTERRRATGAWAKLKASREQQKQQGIVANEKDEKEE